MSRALRSLLFIPGDSDKKLGKVAGCGADAVILDLEDAVAPANKLAARDKVADFLRAFDRGASGAPELWVRINPLDSGLAESDLAAIVPAQPDGIVQPKPDGPEDVARVSSLLDHMELAHELKPGSIGIIPVATETAIAPFRLGEYAGAGLTRLRTLYMDRMNVTDAGLEHLSGLADLRQISLAETKTTAAGRARLKEALPDLSISDD